MFPDRAFRKSLHDGVIEGTAFDKVRPQLKAADIARRWHRFRDCAEGQIGFLISNSTFDGRFANVSWLQEPPDPDHQDRGDNALISRAGQKSLVSKRNDIVSLTGAARPSKSGLRGPAGTVGGTVALELS